MKQIVCEMCGGKELVKQDGLFVCQNCGMKYSVEDARKMMIEGTVDVSGSTVKVDQTESVNKYLQLAQNANSSGNYNDCETYAKKVLEIDPQNAEAWYLVGVSVCWQSSINSMRVYESETAWKNAIKYADEAKLENTAGRISNTLDSVSRSIHSLYYENMESTLQVNSYLGLLAALGKYIQFYINVNLAFSIRYATRRKGATNPFVNPKTTYVSEKVWRNFADNLEKSTVSACRHSYGCDSLLSTARAKLTICGSLEGTVATIEENARLAAYDRLIEMYGNLQQTLIDGHFNVGDLFVKQIDEVQNKKEKTKRELQDAERKKLSKMVTEYANMSVAELLTTAYQCLGQKNFLEAEARFEAIIQKLPDEQLGYVGKAVAMCYGGTVTKYKDIFAPIRTAAEKSSADEYKPDVAKLVNYRPSEEKLTLLMHGCKFLGTDVVKNLLDLGADVHAMVNNATALWLICYTTWPDNSVQHALEIATLLLDKGASVDVTADSGIALYNKNTDPQLKKLLRSREPSLGKSRGCYVATCVYGSYDCPQVWTLRRYRDNTLASTWYGRAFIKTYYAVSPTLVKRFGHTDWFKNMWRGTLDRMVSELRAEGVESTPYEDRDW